MNYPIAECAGCGAVSEDGFKPCDCVTMVGISTEPDGRQIVFRKRHDELPDDIRIPLHELQADVDYLIGRVIEDGSCGAMIAASIKTKLAAIETALANGTRRQAPQPAGAEAKYKDALERIALLDEADGHELREEHAFEAVAIATSTLGKHPSEIHAARYAAPSAQGKAKADIADMRGPETPEKSPVRGEALSSHKGTE